MPSDIFHLRILAAATTGRARRTTPSSWHKGRFSKTLEIVETHFRSIVPEHEL
jgi:hypothetical protein